MLDKICKSRLFSELASCTASLPARVVGLRRFVGGTPTPPNYSRKL